ncbi:MAG: hypothetical protein M3Y50_04805 [Acidobacteriota bacterium]|nr:hypothetical protein [Acidobacteriota bacterium]
MASIFRPFLLLLLPSILSVAVPVFASSLDENVPDAQALSQLEIRAQQASPRDQCFLYTELVHTMTELAGKQMRDGDLDQASVTLEKISRYAQLIHMGLGSNSKRLKNAEMLLEHTTYRLGEYVRHASYEDRASMQSTLKQLDQVHTELLAQIFAH